MGVGTYHSGEQDGYVRLQRIPYRTHWLLKNAVMERTRPGDRILDCGVSSGYLAKTFVDEGRRVDGIELDPEAAKVAMSVCDRVWIADLQTFDLDELRDKYEVALFGDTLEHLPDPASVLRSVGEHLTRTGVVVVSLPNVANWSVRLRLLAGNFRYTERGLLDRTHLRFFTKRTAVEMLKGTGFEVVDFVASTPVPGVSSPPICRLAHLIGNLWPALLGYQFVITARRLQEEG
jgi:2-polyprenyl-3-methyl-5-hydroxy-6-metoxy-1,4-benzoquinol methylase